jgi:hypothetical protein
LDPAAVSSLPVLTDWSALRPNPLSPIPEVMLLPAPVPVKVFCAIADDAPAALNTMTAKAAARNSLMLLV